MEVAGTIAALVHTLAVQVMTIKQLHDQIQATDAKLMSIVSQLSTIKAALVQIELLLRKADYDEQLQSDLEVALQATQLHVDFIAVKISKLKTKHNTLTFGSKVRMVFENDDMEACLQRMNNQATALNLLITVLMSTSVTEQKAMLQRSNTRRVFRQIQEDNASLRDDTASLRVLRDSQSVQNAMGRTMSDTFIMKDSWKRFSFDSQVLGSRAYGGKLFGNRTTSKYLINEEVCEVDAESFENDHMSEPGRIDATKSKLEIVAVDNTSTKPRRFSKMLALGHTKSDISNIVANAQHLWCASNANMAAQGSLRRSTAQMYRLSTKYFDLSIASHTLGEFHGYGSSAMLLERHKDVSSILFTVKIAIYQQDERMLERDLDIFARIADDYNLWLATIILFLDTEDLDPFITQSVTESVKQRFLRVGGTGINENRIRLIVGESDETAAGTIFAVCNESQRAQENKWAGLTKLPTY